MTKCTLPRDRSFNSSAGLAAALLLALSPLAKAETRAPAIPSQPLTLSDCIALALQESPLLEASRFDVASATEEARAARSQNLPEITATGTAEIFSGSPTSKFSVVNLGETPAGLAINQN